MLTNLSKTYGGRRVLVTGHTGFKGSWLTLWLTYLGARVIGFSVDFPSDPCNFVILDLQNDITHVHGDVRDLAALQEVFASTRPEIVFHLAAQALIKKSYRDPKLTFDVNLNGTLNVLECLRSTPSVQAAVIITSDKCYANREWAWGYREIDTLGGDDPYSASKACAEIACHAYVKSFLSEPGGRTGIRVATTRAGNVIGGGDWAQDRIIPDCVRALSKGDAVIIRHPDATRPWQHVLEPLSGYLWLGANLLHSSELHGQSFNFGPDATVNRTVRDLIQLFISHWGSGSWRHEKSSGLAKENTLLKLSCDKALQALRWHACLSYEDTVRLTAEWFRAYYAHTYEMRQFALGQIDYYVHRAQERHLQWSQGGA